jgi:nitrilase
VNDAFTAACVQAEPVVLDRAATIERLASLTAEAAREAARLVVFPETFVAVYPSSVWAKALAGWADPRAKQAFARLFDQAVAVPGPDADRLGEIAREHGVWLVTGVNEVDPSRNGTIYNSLLYHAPDGRLALHHRKLVPTNHERLIWGQGDGGGLRALETELGRIGGLICWRTTCRWRASPSTSRAWRSTSPPQPTMPMRGRRRSCTSRASRARS